MSSPEKLPRGLEVAHTDGKLLLIYRHHRGAGFFLFLAGLFWLVMLVPCYQVLARHGTFGLRELVAFLPFLGTAFGFVYVGLAKLLNKTEVTLSADLVTVGHHPLPWFGNVKLPASQVKGYQIRRDLLPQDVRHRVTVALVADLHDGSQVPLLRAISDSKAALVMQREAQAHLNEMVSSDIR
jgi:hypothetical protein